MFIYVDKKNKIKMENEKKIKKVQCMLYVCVR